MSNSKRLVGTVSAETAASINFKKVETSEKKQGPLVIVAPSKLASDGITGLVAQGIYEKTAISEMYKNKEYYIRETASDTLYIVRGSKTLDDQMKELEGLEGTAVQIIYNGKTKSKNPDVKDYHNFDVLVAR